ncbi:MAG: hypothetical protein WC374_02625 [Phycisphaerae bacterium]|jgi:hypothetical protein
MAGFRYIYAIFVIAVLLILTVHLRNRCDRICNLIISTEAQQSRLKQQLWQKQLQLESYMSPTMVFKSLPNE